MTINANNEPLYVSKMRTSVHGRSLFIDTDGMLAGPPEHRVGVTTLGSTGNNLPAHGVSRLNAAAASTYVLDTPMQGIRKTLFQIDQGSCHNIITGTSNIKIASTLGSSQQRVCLQSTGDWCTLVGLSSALWAVVGLNAGVSITT